MKTTSLYRTLLLASLAAASLFAGCKGPVEFSLAAGTSSGEYRIRNRDYDTNEAASRLNATVDDFVNTMAVAKPQNGTYDFIGFGNRWVVAEVPGDSTVRATGDRDFMMICDSPDDTTLFGNDDFDTTLCTGNGDCDPGLVLSGAGTWTCAFTVSPFNTDFYPNNSPIGGHITISVE
jgi:hypothetical protein